MRSVIKKLTAAFLTAVFAVSAAIGTAAANLADYHNYRTIEQILEETDVIKEGVTYSGTMQNLWDGYWYRIECENAGTLTLNAEVGVSLWGLSLYDVKGDVIKASKYNITVGSAQYDNNENLEVEWDKKQKKSVISASYKVKKGTYIALACNFRGEMFAGKVRFSYNKAATKLAAPTNIKVSSANSNTIKLTWDKVNGASAYRVYKYDSSKKKYVKYKNVTGTSCTVKNLIVNTTYKFKVAALVKSGSKYVVQTASSVVKARTVSTADAKEFLPSPATIRYKPVSNGIEFSWSEVKGADAYGLYVYNFETGHYEEFDISKSTTCILEVSKENVSFVFRIAPLVESNGSYLAQNSSCPFVVCNFTNAGVFTPPSPGDLVTEIAETGISDVVFESITLSEGDIDNMYSGNVIFGTSSIQKGVESYVDLHYNSAGKFSGYTLFVPSDKTFFEANVKDLQKTIGQKPVEITDNGNNGYSWITENGPLVMITFYENSGNSYFKFKVMYIQLIK